MSRHSKSSRNSGVPDLVIMLLIAFYALPFVGLYLLTVPGKKDLGVTLIVIGVVLWIVVGVATV